MRITVTVEEPDDAFRADLLALLAKHSAVVELDTEWTVERAGRFYQAVPPRAQRLLREAAITANGFVSDEKLREELDGKSLRGHAGPLKRALERGVREGWWPEAMQPPLAPRGPGFGKVKGYQMPQELVSTFYEAITTSPGAGRGTTSS
ncbi:hypothetical protein OG264_38740 (plasmid) [Streptomyces xanthophaeus]|uniref:hypothetical protein n=1 Tax=Streptomyces xanthophaeus TaxID=67385 RepID=UPI002F90FC59|nr:hypothetical protein OG264_38740 [Streptomyces xanthophaeus]WST65835.1 hypothetical protein OG605_39735 [Streptomyces xanthophaeus]